MKFKMIYMDFKAGWTAAFIILKSYVYPVLSPTLLPESRIAHLISHIAKQK
jgi:hypothetical protein